MRRPASVAVPAYSWQTGPSEATTAASVGVPEKGCPRAHRASAFAMPTVRKAPRSAPSENPSAELRANQLDQDSLPPYEVLDAILEAYVEQNSSPSDIVARGVPAADVARVVRLIKVNEYKRRQAAVGIRITPRGFGKDWRYPITSAWSEWQDHGPR